jgi:hypothetical protein
MTTDLGATSPTTLSDRPREAVGAAYGEGIRAGLVGAVTVAGWFFLLDAIAGRPFYTPSVLGTALFRGGVGLSAPDSLPISFEMVVSFTWVHTLAFLVIGLAASHLIALAEANPGVGFGLVLLFVVFECGFTLVCMVAAQPVLEALAWPSVLAANLLAATAMVATFWRRHPKLTIEP